jgi:hypothetical protein
MQIRGKSLIKEAVVWPAACTSCERISSIEIPAMYLNTVSQANTEQLSMFTTNTGVTTMANATLWPPYLRTNRPWHLE